MQWLLSLSCLQVFLPVTILDFSAVALNSKGGEMPFQSVSCGDYSSNLTFSTDVFDSVMSLLSLNSSVVAQMPERALHLPNYLQGQRNSM